MSGRPVLHKLCKYIEARGGDSWVLDRIASGETPGAIAKDITLPGHGGISRPLLYQWRDAGGDERKAAWAEAMTMRGEQLVEEAGEILDELADKMPTSAEVSLAKERANHRRWLGGKLNERFSDRPGDTNILIANGPDAFHAALTKHGQRRALTRSTAIEADFTIEEEGNEQAD